MPKNIETRPNSTAIEGMQWGDEGKAKISDAIVNSYIKQGLSCVDYGVNGGANAGHTIEINPTETNKNKISLSLHQLPSGVFNPEVHAILGNNRVVNPQGLAYEIQKVKDLSDNPKPSIKISSMATLALPTHQAYELALKQQGIGKGATGQGISPAYSDRVLRQELTVKDLIDGNFDLFDRHYDYYYRIIAGLGLDMSAIEIPVFSDTKGQRDQVGSKEHFISELKKYREILSPYTQDVYDFIKETWDNPRRFAFLFEMSQGVGLHPVYGVKPDVTASDTTFLGINSSTEGLVDYREIKHRIGITKLYCSSVGARKLPTQMPPEEATWHRNTFNEFGATTGRPRDIAYPDMVATAYYARVSDANEIAITHMDASEEKRPIKICTAYQHRDTKQRMDYRPYQEWMNQVEPRYTEIPGWSSQRVNLAQNFGDLPTETQEYIRLVSKLTHCRPVLLGTGPERKQIIEINPRSNLFL